MFSVSTMGELNRGIDGYVSNCSTVNLKVLRQKLGRQPTDEDVEAEFRAVRAIHLTAIELAAATAIGNLLDLNTGFARIWGGTRGNRLHVNLSIEFCLFDDDVEGWKKVRAWIKREGGIENVMDRRTHLDKWKPADSSRWKIGKNHGRPETQIDVIWNVTHLTRPQIEFMMQTLRKSCGDELWHAHGVSVI